MDKKEILERKLSQLEDLTWEEQKEMFFELFGFDCGLSNGKNIKKRLFNKLQEIYLGGVSESDQLILRRIAENDDRANLRQVGKNRNMTQTALSDNAGISCSDILQIFESDFWTEISAGEYNRLVQLLIERAVVWQDHIDIEIKTEGIKSLIGEFCNA